MKKSKILLILLAICFNFNSLKLFSQALKSDSIHVSHYSINLELVNLSNKTLKGFTELNLISKRNELKNIELDLLKLIVDSVKINSQVSNFLYNDTVLRIQLPTTVDSGLALSCKVYYHGIPVLDATGWGGFYFQADGSYAYNMGVGMSANPHNYGRVWFPCLDDFIDKSTYSFHITTNNQNTAVCNGLLTSITNNANSTRTFHWNLSQPISTYLASVSVGNYVQYTDSFHSVSGQYIPIQIFTRPNEALNVAGSFANLKSMLDAFEHYFGAYKFDRIGYVAVPFSGGAMEHATTISIGNDYIDGSLNYESLIAHELSHHWFGNLITCSSEKDMWINEGWASYCENLFDDYFYGEIARKNSVRALTKLVIETAHVDDGAYLPLSNMPHANTYGTTVYQKGATVAHSLRGYMGDSLFFLALKQIMLVKSYKSISTIEFKTLLENYSGLSLTSFFQSWVDEPGFNHYSLDSMNVTPMSSPYFHVDLYLKQKLFHKPNLAQNNKVWLRLMDENWKYKDVLVQFNGAFGMYSFNCEFEPKIAMVDYNEMLCDAVIDEAQIVKNPGLISFDNNYFKLDVKTASDSSLFRISHHYVAPDSMHFAHPGFRFSKSHYWTVNGIFSSGFNATARFQYNRAMFDKDILKLSNDYLVVYYRKDASEKWQQIASTKYGSFQSGYLYVDNVKNGEYALGAWDFQYTGIAKDVNNHSSRIKVFPNPSSSVFSFEFEPNLFAHIEIVNTHGVVVYSDSILSDSQKIRWNSDGNAPGTYFALFRNANNKIKEEVKLLKIK